MGFFRQTSRTLWYVNQMDKIAQKGEDHLAWLDQQMTRRKGDPQFRKNILFDYDKRVANRAKKAAAQATHATCQICERRIQANTGVIAHHGYQRPGHGWQTQSCYGARFPAYEHSNSAMQPYIDMVTTYRAQREEGLKGLLEEPPEEFTITVKMNPFESIKVPRPEGFSVQKMEEGYAIERTKYEREWKHRVYEARSAITNATREIERMTKRLAEWKPKKEKKA